MIDPNTAHRIHEETQQRLDAMRERAEAAERRADELEAHVEIVRGLSERLYSACNENDAEESMARLRELIDTSPAVSLAAHDAALLQELMDICDRLKYRDVSQSRYNAALGDIHAAAEMIGIQRGAFQSDAIERGEV